MSYIIIIPRPYLHHCLPTFVPWWISAAVTTAGGGGAGIYQVKRQMHYNSKIDGMLPR